MNSTEVITSWLKENHKLWMWVFLIGLFSYGFSVFNYNFGIDEDSAFAWGPKGFFVHHAMLNRWAMFAYYYVVLPGVFYPFIGNVLAILFISLSYCMFISKHPSLSLAQKLLFGGIAISLPPFGTMLEFSFMAAQVSCSAALIIFGYLLTIKGNTLWTKWLLPILLCTFAIFTYQSLLYIFPGVFFIDCLLGKFCIAKKSSCRILGRIIFICGVSLGCYVVGSKILHLITGIPQNHYGESVAVYLHRPLLESLRFLCGWLATAFKSTLLSPFWFLPVPLGILLLWGKPRWRYMVLLLLLIGYFFFPFLGLGLTLPIRSWFFAPFVYAALFLSASLVIPHKFRILFFIFSLWIVCFNSSINARSALLDDFSVKRDQLIASRIYNEVSDIAPKYLKDTKESLIIGTVKLPRILPKVSAGGGEIYGASFFSWCGEYIRIYRYLSIFGVELPPTINASPKAKMVKSLPAVRDMPAYPAKGFVKVVDEVLVIKLASQNQ